ncbi:MAG: bifunctional UDP-N-acetylglucosamine diphosphorylase/glucosamine-1-phosphate N-acetyltransferase GlmU [Nitrospiraceae bacterium]|nr:bifunctional UDP-N-acetylglucosamine diphosphorylase/glucosamine-1-phosphate N-acetyltransferase GlmU [Nitrospiraceae bacterium]
MKPTIVILAAGLGTRMKSSIAKALHPLAGQPLIRHVLNAAFGTDPEQVVLVLGHQADKVRNAIADSRVRIVLQAEQLGTGHAVQQAVEAISSSPGPIMILCADTPLLTTNTLKEVLALHEKSRAAVTLLTTAMPDPFGYGRVVRGKSGVMRVVEEKDATAAQRKIQEVNAGIYCFEAKFLLSSLALLGKNNAQGEYYLPDTIALARKKKRSVAALLCSDPDEVMGVNSRYDLSRAEAVMRQRTNRRWMLEGVTMLDPGTVFVGSEASLGRDVVLYPNVRIEGRTKIGDTCVIYPGTRIVDSVIASHVTVKDCSVIEESNVASRAIIGPFAHLRPGAMIEEAAHIGNFVEIKKSTIGKGSKANHLAYIGDATVGADVNIGAGVITCNYDGFQKFQTVIGDGVFVGSDSQLVAPVTIGRGALIAAGATITRDVPAEALGISRPPQEIREGFASRRRKMKQKKR